MKTNKIVALIFTLTLFFLVHVNTSSASEVILNETEIEKLRENYISLGIDVVTGEKLIQKVLNGELLDSQNPEKIKEKQLNPLSIGETNIIEFDDGSRISLQMAQEEKPSILEKPSISPFGYSEVPIKNNNCSSGSGYNTCVVTVRYDDMIWDISYKTTVTRTQGGQTTITKPRNVFIDMVLYNWEELDRDVSRAKSTSSKPARAFLKFKADNFTNLYTVTRELAVYANNSSIYARLEWP